MTVTSAIRGTASLAVVVLMGCSTTPKPIGTPLTEERIEFATFSVGVPSGTGWGVERDAMKEYVVFTQRRSVSLWEAGAGREKIVTLRAFKIPLLRREDPLPSEQSLADEYISVEERQLGVNVMRLYEYKVKIVAKGEKTVGDRRVHFMRYEQGGMTESVMGIYVGFDGLLYVYFPPGYEKAGALYGFLVSHMCMKCSLSLDKADIDRLDDMLRSFAVRPTQP